jgi:thiamine-phosphate pyrophosphorylase
VIVGVSVRTPGEARKAEEEGADYLGAGAVFPTPSKPDARVIGLAGLRAICRSTRLPVVAIGGITVDNARRVRRAGADGIAVISAVFGSGGVSRNLRMLREASME